MNLEVLHILRYLEVFLLVLQLALSYVRYRYTTFFKSRSAFEKFFFDALFGILFPIWCIFYLVAPWSKLGGKPHGAKLHLDKNVVLFKEIKFAAKKICPC